jgi:hypothetical protein
MINATYSFPITEALLFARIFKTSLGDKMNDIRGHEVDFIL